MQPDQIDAANKRLVREIASIAGFRVVEPVESREWPQEMASDAFIGLPGDFVRLVAPNTEADPVALLGNFLVGTGVLFGREAYAVADGRRHYPVESLLVTGQTGSGRKGTATGRVMPVLEAVEENFSSQHVLSGLSSGEGLIKGNLARRGRHRFTERCASVLALLPEFASLLTVMKREGNTLSSILREAWDCSTPARAHAERASRRGRREPVHHRACHPGRTVEQSDGDRSLQRFCESVSDPAGASLEISSRGRRRSESLAYRHAPTCSRRSSEGARLIARDSAARSLWANEYERITRPPRDGIRGALCGRAEAHVLRLSLLYAL